MPESYTPTLENIREAYEYWSAGLGGSDSSEIDRFVAGIKAEALRSAAEMVDTYPTTDQASKGLRAFADLIEKEVRD